jgi:GGDEF domain-containing protein
VAHRIRESLAKDGRKPSLSVSVGVALYPTNGDKLDTLLGAADVALYSMKAQARDRVGKPKNKRTESFEITRRRRSAKV